MQTERWKRTKIFRFMEEIRAYKRRENPICFLPTHHLMFNKVCCSHSDLEVIGVFCMPVCLCLLCKLRINSSSIRLVLLLKCLSSLCNFLYQRYTYLKSDIDIIVCLWDMYFGGCLCTNETLELNSQVCCSLCCKIFSTHVFTNLKP